MNKNLKCNHLHFLILFLIIEAYIFISPCYAASSSRCAILTIYASGDAGISAVTGDSGHTWLTIQNTTSRDLKFLSYTIKPAETISISKWQDGGIGKGGVYINLEQITCIGRQTTSYSIVITRDQLKEIEKKAPGESKYDVLMDNCTTYSTKMWQLIDNSKRLSADDIYRPGAISIPGDAAKTIASWRGAKKATYEGNPKTKWTDVYFVEKTGKLKCVGFYLISPANIKLNAGEHYKIQVKTKDSGGAIKWSSSNRKVASVDKKGKVSTKQKGTASIIAKHGKATVIVKVTVCNKSLKLSCNSLTLTKGKTKKLTATVKGASKEVVWTSSRPSVATVSDNGVVTAVSGGKTIISATANGITKKCSVKVKSKKSITISCKSLSLSVGETATINAIVTGMKRNIKWSTSNKKIATVKNGKVTGKKKGTVTITARCGRLKAKCKVTVKNEGVYHTENGESLYEDDYTQNRLFNLKIDIVGNKLYIEGKLLRLRNGKREHVTGNKHIFILSSETNYREGDVPINKDRFLYDAKNYMNMWANLDTLALGIYVVDGKVVSVYWH